MARHLFLFAGGLRRLEYEAQHLFRYYLSHGAIGGQSSVRCPQTLDFPSIQTLQDPHGNEHMQVFRSVRDFLPFRKHMISTKLGCQGSVHKHQKS